MSERSTILLIGDILESAQKIVSYTYGMTFDDFVQDDKTIDAFVRNFEIIGEAANRIPSEFKTENSKIDWKRIRGFRNRIVYDYFGIDFSIVWNIKEKYLPELILNLKIVLEK